ncbi:MAG TPA: antitoxin Xre/MbcA/ParS toxin-binding domain-containing protein, partial [Candidatus Methylomirabilis sp.]
TETAAPAPPATPEMNRLLREYKERHYADWTDHPLPALAGQTPREAVRTRRGREAVYALLKEMEYLERQAGDAAYDFSGIRKDLGLP